MHVLLYLRVSSEGQARKGNPIATQRVVCLEYAQKLGYEVDEAKDIYVDNGVSGKSTRNRLAFKQMMERVRTDENVVGLIAYDTSRISRNLRVYLDFKDDLKKYNKKFFSISEPYFNDDSSVAKLMEQIMASFSEFRSGQDGEKIREAMRHKAEVGIYPGKATYGYKNIRSEGYGGKEKRWIESDPVESAYVKEIFRRYATKKYSLRSLADELNQEGVPSPNRKHWGSSGIENILKNKTYIGHIDWGGVNNPNGQHEKLVDEAVFHRVQTILRVKNHCADKSWKHAFILRGFSYCGECGSRINGYYHQKSNGKIYVHYGCQKKQHSKPVSCSQSVVQTREIEKQFQKLVKAIQIPESAALRLEEKIKKAVEGDRGANKQFQKSVRMQLENVRRKKETLFEKYIEKLVDDDVYRTHKEELEGKEIQLQEQLAKVNGITEDVVSRVEKAINLARNCYKTYLNAPFEQKILLARTLFEKVIIRDGMLQKAFLNHPFVFVCGDKASRVAEFQYQYNGGGGEI